MFFDVGEYNTDIGLRIDVEYGLGIKSWTRGFWNSTTNANQSAETLILP